jgi:hypothetical protein
MNWLEPSTYAPNREAAARRAAAQRAGARGNSRKVKENLLAAQILDGVSAEPAEVQDHERGRNAKRTRAAEIEAHDKYLHGGSV